MARILSALICLILMSPVLAADVFIYTWENTDSMQQRTTQKMYVAGHGLVVEQLEAGSMVPESDIVVLRDGRVIINDNQAQTSSIMDPNDMPGLPAFGGGNDELASAMQQAQAEMQRAMADMTPEQRQAMEQAMSGLLPQQGGAQGIPSLSGLFGGSSQPAASPELRETGNSGMQSGRAWSEVSFQMLGKDYLYRLVDWSDIQGAETVSAHYSAMSETMQSFMDSMGLAGMMEGMSAWPQQISEYMTENQKFPVYIQQGNDTQELTDVSSGNLDDSRFGAQFPVQSFGN